MDRAVKQEQVLYCRLQEILWVRRVLPDDLRRALKSFGFVTSKIRMRKLLNGGKVDVGEALQIAKLLAVPVEEIWFWGPAEED